MLDPLRERSEALGAANAVTFLPSGKGSCRQSLTYADLAGRAQSVATALMQRTRPGDRVLLAMDSGLAFAPSFFGCLIARRIAVPFWAAGGGRVQERFARVLDDAAASAVLVDGAGDAEAMRQAFPGLLVIDACSVPTAVVGWDSPNPDDVALLQYTSGTTGEPKGICITHGNLAANQAALELAVGDAHGQRILSWLPLNHNMGLMAGLLQPIWQGLESILMRPVHFAQNPLSWLEMMGREEIDISGGPNSAFEICSNIPRETTRDLDFSHWRVAFVGSEAISPATLHRFSTRYAENGFDPAAWMPMYGLAEATVYVSGSRSSAQPRMARHDVSLVAPPQVSVGQPAVNLAIVDPAGLERLDQGLEGEIWVSGPTVSPGYWRREAPETFAATLQGESGRWLRTGDLGYLRDNHLYVSGRIKEMLIVNGQNYYPQDIEATVLAVSQQLTPGGCAAFSTTGRTGEEGERLVVVAESSSSEPEALAHDVRSAVATRHGLEVYELLFLSPGVAPRTRSGKIQRLRIKELYLGGALAGASSFRCDESSAGGVELIDREKVEQVVQAFVLDHLAVDPADAAGRSLIDLGADSLAAVAFRAETRSKLGVDFPLQSFLSSPSISALVDHVTELPRDATPVRPVHSGRGEYEGSAVYPLSAGQQSLWFLQQLRPEDSSYNVAFAARVLDNCDANALSVAVGKVIAKHEQLRVRFELAGGEPVQRVVDAEDPPFVVQTVSGSDVATTIDSIIHTPFDLASELPLRVRLLNAGEEQYLLVVAHHAVCDGESMRVVLTDLADSYGSVASRPHAGLTYRDFVASQRHYLSSGEADRDREWWQAALATTPRRLPLPYDNPTPAGHDDDRLATFSFGSELTAAVRQAAMNAGVTVSAYCLAAFALTVQAWTGQREFAIGVPAANRTDDGYQGTVGYFVNTIPFPVRIGSSDDARTLVRSTGDRLIECLTHQQYPYNKLVDDLASQAGLAERTFLQLMFTMERSKPDVPLSDFLLGTRGSRLRMGDLHFESYPISQQEGQFDLDLTLYDSGGALDGSVQFDQRRFRLSTAQLVAARFLDTVRLLVQMPDERVTSLHLKPFRLEDTGEPIHRRVASWAHRAPGSVAIVDQERRLTYAELDRSARSMASRLLTAGTREGEVVPIVGSKSAEVVEALMAVLYAGAAYELIDEASPAALARTLLTASAPRIVIALSTKAQSLARCGPWTVLGPESFSDPEGRHQQLPVETHPEGLAYLVRTSGTTGPPKRVLVCHKGLAAAYDAWEDEFRLAPGDVHLQLAGLTFDVFAGDWIRALASGARLVLCQREGALDPERLASLIDSTQATIAEFVPTVLRPLAAYLQGSGRQLESLTRVMVGSEPWTPHDLRRFRAVIPQAKFYNTYGVSECSIDSTCQPLGGGGWLDQATLPVGWPIQHTSLAVVHQDLTLCDEGEPGELIIGGAGLARGYADQPGLTAARFVPFPGRPGERGYRTGDAALVRPNGSLELLGRIDRQVKVHGERVELQGVEVALRALPGIVDSAAVQPEAGRSLTAFVVPTQGTVLETAAVRDALKEALPPAQVPGRLLVLAELPHLPNGKVDLVELQRLAEAELASANPPEATRSPDDEPSSVTSQWCQVFASVLRSEVTPDDSFFALGGDSIQCMQVVSLGKERGLRATLADVYEAQTPTELARLTRIDHGRTADIPPVGEVDLLPAQAWFFSQGFTEPERWSQYLVLQCDAKPEIVAAAVEAVTRHHDAFRARYRRTPTGWVQEFIDSPLTGLAMEILDSASQATAAECIALKSLNLQTGPIARAVISRDGERTRLFWAVHHLLVDGVSWRILLDDLGTACSAIEGGAEPRLPVRITSLSSWAQHLRRLAEQSDPPMQNQPQPVHPDMRDGSDTEDSTRMLTASLCQERTETLARSGTGIEPYFVAAVARAIAEQQGVSSVSVELESHGRDPAASDLDVSRTIGWLTALYPVKLEHLDPGEPLAQLTTRVQRSLTAASESGLGQSARRFLVEHETDAPHTSVNYLGVLDLPTQRNGICVADLGVDRSPDARRSYLFEFDSFVRDNHLSVQLRYSSRRFRTETAQSLLDSVLHTLAAAADRTPATGGPVLDTTGSGLPEAELTVFLQTLGQA